MHVNRVSLGCAMAVQQLQPMHIWSSTQTVPARCALVGNAARTPLFLAHRKRIKHRECSGLLHYVRDDGMLLQDLMAHLGKFKSAE